LAALKVVGSAPATLAAKLLDALWCVSVLLDLGTREGILDFGDFASGTFIFLGGVVDLPTLGSIAIGNFATEALGSIVDTNPFPLVVVEGIKGQELHTLTTRRCGCAAVSEGWPVHGFSSQGLQQEPGSLGHASVKEEGWKGPQDEAVVSAADATGSDGAEGGIDFLVYVEVQQHGR